MNLFYYFPACRFPSEFMTAWVGRFDFFFCLAILLAVMYRSWVWLFLDAFSVLRHADWLGAVNHTTLAFKHRYREGTCAKLGFQAFLFCFLCPTLLIKSRELLQLYRVTYTLTPLPPLPIQTPIERHIFPCLQSRQGPTVAPPFSRFITSRTLDEKWKIIKSLKETPFKKDNMIPSMFWYPRFPI